VVCERCGTQNPDFSAFCARCGASLLLVDGSRRGREHAFALHPAEAVRRAATVSTVMPHTSRHATEAFRWALASAAVVILVLTAFGYVPAALIAAAVAVPITYLLYMIEVNVWEASPNSAILLVFAVAIALSAAISWVFFQGPLHDWFRELTVGNSAARGGIRLPLLPFLLFTVALPVLALALAVVGPILLLRRPGWDHMIDALTFGVAAGAVFSATETVVAFWPAITGDAHVTEGVATWIPIVLNLMVVRTLLYGTAAGMVVAAFAGPGEGDAGFGSRFARTFLLAAAALVAYRVGGTLLGYVDQGAYLSLFWGGAVLAVLTIRARIFLHTALLESALEDVQGDRRGPGSAGGGTRCPECGMPTLEGALFCVSCGLSVHGHPAAVRRAIVAGVEPGGVA
jgi:hypothetical protein